MPTFVVEDHMLDWHTCQIRYPLKIKLLLLLLLLLLLSVLVLSFQSFVFGRLWVHAEIQTENKTLKNFTIALRKIK